MANGGLLGLDNEALVEDEFGGSGGSGSMTDSEMEASVQEVSGESDTDAGGEVVPFREPIALVDPVSPTLFPAPDEEAEEDLSPTGSGDPEMPERTSSEDRDTGGGGPLQIVQDNPVLAGAAALAGGLLLFGR